MLRPSTDGFLWRLRDAFYESDPDSLNGTLLTSSTSVGMAFNIFYPFVYMIYISVQFTRLLVLRLFRLITLVEREDENAGATRSSHDVSSAQSEKQRRCEYDYLNGASPSTSEQSDTYRENYLSVHSMTSAPNPYTLPPSNFPALYFVDPSVFHNHHVETPKASVILPSYVAEELGSCQQHEYIGRLFFHTIHAWFPIVSRKRFYEELHESAEGLRPGADFGFLLLSMKLMTWRPPSSESDPPAEGQTARTATYRAAKQCSFELEAAGVISLRILQGMLLVALYEVGHAIYPAAFMSVSACVRYAHGLGIQPGGMQRLKLPLSWVEEEERKRVWWSAFLLDRFVSLSCPGCPAMIDEPEPDNPLPVDDAHWDEGATNVPCSPLLHSPVSMEFGRFALLIQAFVLLSKVSRLTSSTQDASPQLLKDEAQQWSASGETGYRAVSFTRSLRSMYTSSTISVEMPDSFIESLADELINSNYEHLVTAARRGRDEISPFLIQLLYQTSVLLLKGERPKSGDGREIRVEKLKDALLWLDKRWQLAGESVILPSDAVFLVHKVGRSKAGRETQWETRSKAMRAAPGPVPRISTATEPNSSVKAMSDAAEGGAWEFVTYLPHKDQQPPKRPKELKRRRRKESAATLPKPRSVVSIKQPNLSPNPSVMIPDVPVNLVGHALLYVNFWFHSIATGAYSLPCLLFNPAKRDWFPSMMQDEAWRCLILSLSASTLASVTGSSSNYLDAHTLLDEALRQLKGRVASGTLPSDQTLGAIACLSMWSNELGNHDKAWIHAKGLAELVKLRGGFPKISDRMRSKVYRGVFDIAVDVDRPPVLHEGLRDSPSRETNSEDSLESEESSSSSSGCAISPRLSSIFQDVVQFSTTVDDAIIRNTKLDTTSLYETVFGLYSRLLTCQSDTMSGCDNSLRICLILYIKSIVSQDRVNATSMNLVRKLQASIQGCPHSSTPLTRWKLLVGGMVATDGTAEQQWCLQHLAAAATENNMVGEEGWKALQVELSDVLWAKPIHETAGYRLWLQIEGIRTT
ncbi:hypothetical protein V8C42DRAFT_351003 [Trichoderma barbatum]